MSRRGENIYKRKDGRWEGRYITGYGENGKAIYKSVYSHSYAEVREKLKKIRSECRELSVCREKFSDYAEQWLDGVRIGCKISTYCKYSNVYRLHIMPVLGDCQIGKIERSHIRRIIEGCDGLAPKTVSDILCVVKMIIDYIEKCGVPVRICMNGLNVRQDYKHMRVLDYAEQKRFSDVLMKETDLKKLGVYLALCTGIRIGELCALKRENISFEEGVLSVRETLQRVQLENGSRKTVVIISEPKSRSSVRDIPMPHFLTELCREYYGSLSASDYLLTGTTGYMEPRLLQYHFKKYIKESGIDDMNFHTLRHTFATRCVENNFEIRTLSEILGHISVNITLNRYVHSSVELKRTNMEKLSNIF